MKKAIKLLAILLTFCLLLTGCELGILKDAFEAANNGGKEKAFTNAGVTVTLTTSFLDFTNTATNTGKYPFIYASDSIGIIGVQENKAELFDSFEEMDLEGYANLISELYDLNTAAQQKDGFWMLTYETDAADEPQTFVCVFYETDADFWNIQGYCTTAKYAENQEAIWKYLTSVVFAEETK